MGIFSRKSSKTSSTSSDKLSYDGSISGASTLNTSVANSPAMSKQGSLKSPTATHTPMTPLSPVDSVSSAGSDRKDGFFLPKIELPPAPDSTQEPVAYYKSLYSVRQQSARVFERAQCDQLRHFHVDRTKFRETANYIVSIIKRDYGQKYADIPTYSPWQNFHAGGRVRLEQLLASWPASVDDSERTRRFMDLFFITSLLDHNVSAAWKYRSAESGKLYRRSEGLAVACFEAFKLGRFSGDPGNRCQVDAVALQKCCLSDLQQWFQICPENSMPGLPARFALFSRLAAGLNQDASGRPGNLLDSMLRHSSTLSGPSPVMSVPSLWAALNPIIATAIARESCARLDNDALGDAFRSPHDEKIFPLHHLAQTICYALIAPMQRLSRVRFVGLDLLTAVPDSRNGGLLVDTGLLSLKDNEMQRGLGAYSEHVRNTGCSGVEVVPLFSADDDVIVEWRAATIGYLDALLLEVNQLLGLSGSQQLSLSQMLEAGTAKGGLELAEVSRPNTKEAPIVVSSEVALF